MKLYNQLKSWISFSGNKQSKSESFCPNCWGRQEYGGTEFEADLVNNRNEKTKLIKKGWIQAYLESRIQGKLFGFDRQKQVCDRCKIVYTPK